MILPDRTLFRYLSLLLLTGLGVSILRSLDHPQAPLMASFWWWTFAMSAGLALFDAARCRWSAPPVCQRRLPGNLPLGSNSQISLKFDNPGRRALHFSYQDTYPDSISCDQLPGELRLPAGESVIIKYTVRPVRRGEASFGDIQIRIRSPWGLWRRQYCSATEQTTKVYPNFMALAKLNFLDYEQRLAHIGAHLSQRRGSGQSFKQLREYQRGDELRQIDWKATSRQHRLISREYQDERDQEVVFLLDCGRRMRAMDNDLSHFDHSINALLMTSYIALSAGDAVGFMSYAGTERWLKPVKGKTAINALLNQLYDLHSSAQASDLSQAAEALMLKQKKRSLIIVISNIRDDDSYDLTRAVRLLSKKHLVMVACLRENYLSQGDEINTQDLDSALTDAARVLYAEQRQHLMNSLKANGVRVVDANPDSLHLDLVTQYMALKRAGKI